MFVSDDFARSPVGRYLLDSFLELTHELSGKSISEIFRARSTVNLQSRLSAVAVPTLVINGATDVSLESGRYTASRIPNALHRIVPGAGHICCLEKPAEFDRLVLDFLDAQGYGAA
jgi:pimeloyl-ACP methyl ester carboxylesterase